jgi:hypothetical protein
MGGFQVAGFEGDLEGADMTERKAVPQHRRQC